MDGLVFHEVACGIHDAGDTVKSRCYAACGGSYPLWLFMWSNQIGIGCVCFCCHADASHRILSYRPCYMLAGFCRSWYSIVFGR